MAGDWIPMKKDLWDCPEVVRILSAMCPQNVRSAADKLRRKCEVVGALFKTWSIFDTFSEDGSLVGYDAELLNEMVGIENWAQNLQHVGWLVLGPDSIEMPGFTTHLGQSAKRRMKDAERKKNVRKMSAKCPQNVRSSADILRTTEEKRREENSSNSARTKKETPTLEEVRDYCKLRGNAVSPQKFHDYYTANGWTQGKGKPIKDWQAAVRTWESNDFGGQSSKPATISKPLQPIRPSGVAS